MKKLLALIAAGMLLSSATYARAQDYILMERGGYLSVFQETDLINPSEITDVAVSLLPISDQNRLEKGFRVEGEEALLHILEDLGS